MSKYVIGTVYDDTISVIRDDNNEPIVFENADFADAFRAIELSDDYNDWSVYVWN